MLKKTITYTDFNDKVRTEDFYFHLSLTEIQKFMLSERGGLDKMMREAIDSKDDKAIIRMVEDLIKLAYGVRSEDGRAFFKKEEAYDIFRYSNAYDELFLEVMADEKAAGAFVNAIMPPKLVEMAVKANAENSESVLVTAA